MPKTHHLLLPYRDQLKPAAVYKKTAALYEHVRDKLRTGKWYSKDQMVRGMDPGLKKQYGARGPYVALSKLLVALVEQGALEARRAVVNGTHGKEWRVLPTIKVTVPVFGDQITGDRPVNMLDVAFLVDGQARLERKLDAIMAARDIKLEGE